MSMGSVYLTIRTLLLARLAYNQSFRSLTVAALLPDGRGVFYIAT